MATLRWHPTTRVPDAAAPDMRAATHASRRTLERVLSNPHDDAAWEDLREYYDDQADTWSDWARQQPWYVAPVEEGLRRVRPTRLAVEVSCGTGQATALLDAFATEAVIATDVNISMLENAAKMTRTAYVAADVRRLPFRTGSVPLLVGLNAVPHLAEFARVLDETGQLLWCTSFGAGTPLYVDPQRLVDLLGSGWQGDAGRAGHGEWVLLTREG